jgi:hypothetical protein
MDYGLLAKLTYRLMKTHKASFFQKSKEIIRLCQLKITQLLDIVYYPESTPFHIWINRLWLAGLYILGAFIWCQLLNWGNIPFEYHDWAEGHAARYVFIQDAVIKGQLPLHMPDTSALRNVTDRYLAVADTLFTPQVFLLRFLNIGVFILLNALFLYSLGFVGLLLIRKKYNLSALPFSAMFLLFNVNGQLVAHITVGHEIWWGFFLFPYLILFLFNVLEGKAGWKRVAGVSFVMFFMFLNGAFHLYVWCLMFFGLVALFNLKRTFVPIAGAGLFSVLLNMIRIIPPAITSGFDIGYLGGYVSITDIFTTMVTRRIPCDEVECRPILGNMDWMEYEYYIGFVGLAFILICGIALWRRKSEISCQYRGLQIPLIIMALLTLESVYGPISQLGIPLLNSERVSSRMLIVPLSVMFVIATINFDQYLKKEKRGSLEKVIYLGLWAYTLRDLWIHARLWAVDNLYKLFPATPVNLQNIPVSNHPDTNYTTGLALGAVITGVTLIFLIVMVWRESRHTQSLAAKNP